MDIWQTLEIQPTPDQKAIKRAYAKKLKVTRPDENPQAFQNLHMAYKAALEEALYWEEEQEEWESEENSTEHYQQESLALETPVIQQQENLIETTPETEKINHIISEIPQQSELFQQSDLLQQSENSQQIEITEHPHVAPEAPVQIEEALAEKSVEPEPQQTIEINPYQLEGERLLGIAETLLSKQDAPAKARSWEFIIESPFILEDQFNWQLGLELLQIIHKHNFNHITKNSSMVSQEALSYLNSIFNWIDNRHHVIRALGNEYNTWLDMIKESNPDEKNYANQIRGGKKLLLQQKTSHVHQAPPSGKGELIGKRIAAWFIDVVILTIMIVLLSNGKNAETQQAISTQALTFFSILLIFVYFCGFEASALQATLGKKIMRLAIVNNDGDHPGFLAITFRTFCYFAFCTIFFLILPGVLSIFKIGILSMFFTFFGIYLALKPITLYDKISKTRTIELS